MQRRCKRSFIQLSLMILAAALILTACGKKAPPIPPKRLEAPVVRDLQAHVELEHLLLRWTIPQTDNRQVAPAVRFILYRAQSALAETACDTCPILFKRRAEVALTGKRTDLIDGQWLTCRDSLEKGYQYIYKLKAVTASGALGEDSNYIRVDY